MNQRMNYIVYTRFFHCEDGFLNSKEKYRRSWYLKILLIKKNADL